MISDEIKEQQKKLKEMNAKEKTEYIIYYYKWHILIAIIVLAAAVSFIYNRLTRKEDVFFLEVINSNVPIDNSGDLIVPYLEKASDFDPAKEKMTADYCFIDTEGGDYYNMATDQKVTAMLTVGSIDAMIATPSIMEKYKATECFTDMREVLPRDLQDRLEEAGYEYYYTKITDVSNNTVTDVPIGVIISDTPVIKSGFVDNNSLHQNYYDPGSETLPVYSIMYNSSHPDKAIDFLYFLIGSR
ncbi:MAG: hypothetical protein J5829_00950 [Lachnospiraceae bacterium]|nr:hypothetical protein [Lachnospiraceae bacterium]